MTEQFTLTDRECQRFRIMACLCIGISDETLIALNSRGGLPALLEAARKAEEQFRRYGDLHSAKPDPAKASRNFALADLLASFLPGPAQNESSEERFEREHPERARLLTEEAQDAALEVISEVWRGPGSSNLSRKASEQAGVPYERDIVAERGTEPNFWWRNADVDENGETPREALLYVPECRVELLHASCPAPSKYAFWAPSPSEPDEEDLFLFDTWDEAQDAAKERANALGKPGVRRMKLTAAEKSVLRGLMDDHLLRYYAPPERDCFWRRRPRRTVKRRTALALCKKILIVEIREDWGIRYALTEKGLSLAKSLKAGNR